MVGYVTLGTHDLGRAAAFYDFLFRFVGVRRHREEPGRYVAWAKTPGTPALAVAVPCDDPRATLGNAAAAPGDGATVALELDTPAQVAALHALAVALGGTDEGGPGPRDGGKHFAAFFRDRDGNKLNAFCALEA